MQYVRHALTCLQSRRKGEAAFLTAGVLEEGVTKKNELIVRHPVPRRWTASFSRAHWMYWTRRYGNEAEKDSRNDKVEENICFVHEMIQLPPVHNVEQCLLGARQRVSSCKQLSLACGYFYSS